MPLPDAMDAAERARLTDPFLNSGKNRVFCHAGLNPIMQILFISIFLDAVFLIRVYERNSGNILE